MVTLFTRHMLGAIPNAGMYLEFSIEGPDYHSWQDGLFRMMGQASPARSGDRLAGIAAESEQARVAAQFALADLPVCTFSQ